MGKMQSKSVTFGPWEPDKAVLNQGGLFSSAQTVQAKNCIPASTGFVSIEKPALAEDALPGRAYAGWGKRQTDGTLSSVIGAADGIYSRESTGWESKYSVASVDTNRQFQEWGDDLYALYGKTLLKSTYSATYGAFSAVSGAPSASCMGVIKDFLVLGNVTEEEGGVSVSYPNAIHWCAIDDPTSWPTVGSNTAQYKLSDRQLFPVGGKVQAIVGGVGGADGLIFLERGVQRATFVGTPYIFQFDPVDRSCGTTAPLSPVVCGTACAYLSDDGWKLTDGASVKSIGLERIDRWFFNEIASDRKHEVRGIFDRVHGVALWIFPSTQCPTSHFDRALFYNAQLDRWSYAVIECETVWNDHARGMTLEDLDALDPDKSPVYTLDELDDLGDLDHLPYETLDEIRAQYGNIDALPFNSLDDLSLRAGGNTLNLVDTAHRPGVFSGEAMEAEIDTAEFGGQRMLIHGIRPLVDRGDALALPVYRDRQSLPFRYGEFHRQSRDGVCYCHRSAGYCLARVKIPEGEGWKNAVGCEILYELEGGL